MLHNFRDFVNYVNNKEENSDYSKDWYKKFLESIERDHFYIYARPEVYQYVFKKKWLSKKQKNKILSDSREELLHILKETGLKKFIEKSLAHENNS